VRARGPVARRASLEAHPSVATASKPSNTSPPLEGLIVDFGGVLTSPLQEAMIEFAGAAGIDFQDLVRAALGAYSGSSDSLVTDFETGIISEEEFSRAFAARLTELSGVPISPHGLVTKLFAGLSLEEDMLEMVAAVRAAGYKTALLSNSWGLDLYPHERLDPLFDAVVISGRVGLRKPDPAIFTLTTDRLRLQPSECLFVDDHPGHLDAATEAGMQTLLHTSPATTIAALRTLLGLP
jgi:putative hydrolase of the HAD superfamily